MIPAAPLAMRGSKEASIQPRANASNVDPKSGEWEFEKVLRLQYNIRLPFCTIFASSTSYRAAPCNIEDSNSPKLER